MRLFCYFETFIFHFSTHCPGKKGQYKYYIIIIIIIIIIILFVCLLLGINVFVLQCLPLIRL
jgi:hypothetical protein